MEKLLCPRQTRDDKGGKDITGNPNCVPQSLIPEIEDFDDPSYDPFADSEAVFATEADPFTVMARMRAQGPVHEIEYRVAHGQANGATTMPGARCFMVVAYNGAMEAIRNAGVFSNTNFDQILGLSFGGSDPRKLDRFELKFFAVISPAERSEGRLTCHE